MYYIDMFTNFIFDTGNKNRVIAQDANKQYTFDKGFFFLLSMIVASQCDVATAFLYF